MRGKWTPQHTSKRMNDKKTNATFSKKMGTNIRAAAIK